jgi:hypothetical protein
MPASQGTLIHGRHLCCVIIPLDLEAFGAKQREHPAGVYGRYEAALINRASERPPSPELRS